MVGKTNEEAILIRLDDLEARAFDIQKRVEALEQEAHIAVDRHMARNWQDAAARLREAFNPTTDHTKEIDHETTDDRASIERSEASGSAPSGSGLRNGLAGGCMATGERWAQAEAAHRDLADTTVSTWPFIIADLARGLSDQSSDG